MGQKQLFQISGMWCGSCASTLERQLCNEALVKTATVDITSHTLSVETSESDSSDTIKEIVQRAGFSLQEYDDFASYARRLRSEMQQQMVQVAITWFASFWTMSLSLVLYSGALEDERLEYGLSLCIGAIVVLGLTIGAHRIFRVGIRSLFLGYPTIDSLLSITALVCITLSLFNLNKGIPEVYFDSAILTIAIVQAIRLVGDNLKTEILSTIYSSLDVAEETVIVQHRNRLVRKSARALTPGAIVQVNSGDTFAVDGVVVDGKGLLNDAVLSGESSTKEIVPEMLVYAGSALLEGGCRVRVTCYYGQRYIDKLSKASLQSFHKDRETKTIERIIGYAAPCLLLLSGLSLFFQTLVLNIPPNEAILLALSVVLVACPCALFFCTPFVLLTACLKAQELGFILQRATSLLHCTKIDRLLLDKTGTLTGQTLSMSLCKNQTSYTERELWGILAAGEYLIDHPIAYATQRNANKLSSTLPLVTARELAERGISFRFQDQQWYFGSREFIVDCLSTPDHEDTDLTLAIVTTQGIEFAFFSTQDNIQVPTDRAIEYLRAEIPLIGIVSGDTLEKVHTMAARLKIPLENVHARCSAQQKRTLVEEVKSLSERVMFVGDGFNDVGALSASTVGLSMPHAVPLVRLSSDIHLLRFSDSTFKDLFTLARISARKTEQNYSLAILYNALAIPAALWGLFSPLAAVLLMSSATLLILVNSLTIMKISPSESRPS